MKALSVGLCFLLCMQTGAPPASAQNPPGADVPGQNPPVRMAIVVVEGEAVINNVGQRSARDPMVRVEDENQKPIAGASVVFTLPTEGPSGEFGNGEKTLITTTDARGEAVATGLKVNLAAGRLQIHVNASYRGQTARVNITQFSMAVPGKRAGGGSAKTALIILGIVGAAAGGGAAFALRGKNGSTPANPAPAPTPIGITPGTGIIGPPR